MAGIQFKISGTTPETLAIVEDSAKVATITDVLAHSLTSMISTTQDTHITGTYGLISRLGQVAIGAVVASKYQTGQFKPWVKASEV